MTAADIYLLMVALWHPDPDALLGRSPNLASLCDRVKQDEFVKRSNDFHKLW